MKTIEQIAVSVAGLAVLMKFSSLSGGDTVLAITLLILAVSYNPFGLFFFNRIPLSRAFDRNAYKGVTAVKALSAFAGGVVCSILVTAILFKLLQLPGTEEMMMLGFVGGGGIVAVALIRYLVSRPPGSFAWGILKRTLVLVILALALYVTPSIALVEAFYREHPEYIEAYRRAAADPDNEALQLEAEEIRSEL